MARTGRRPGPSTTRAEVLASARVLFSKHGFEATTVRMIGAEAGVDPALVVRMFGGKDRLFVAAMEWPWDPAEQIGAIIAGPRSQLGRRIAELFVRTWDDPTQQAPLLALLRSASEHDDARRLLMAFLSTQVLGPVVGAAGGDRPDERAAFVAAHLVGIAMARYVLRIEPLARLDASAVVDVAAPILQRLLTGPLP